MDKTKMIAEIAARHSVRLDHDDPAFLLVELNMMAFEEGAEALAKWRDDLAALIGALEQGSKQWEETASSIGKAIFESQKRDFIADIDREKDDFLRGMRTEIKTTFVDALAPTMQRLSEATTHASSKRTVLWAIAGALIGSVITCTATLYVAKTIIATDVANPGLATHSPTNKTR